MWNGHIGTFTANPRNTAPNSSSPIPWLHPPAAPYRWRARISNVCGFEKKNIPRNPSSMNRLPTSVYRMNLTAAYSRLPLPHSPIRKYIGTRTSSQNTMNRIRSNATNVPAMPVSSSSISAMNAFAGGPSGMMRVQ